MRLNHMKMIVLFAEEFLSLFTFIQNSIDCKLLDYNLMIYGQENHILWLIHSNAKVQNLSYDFILLLLGNVS